MDPLNDILYFHLSEPTMVMGMVDKNQPISRSEHSEFYMEMSVRTNQSHYSAATSLPSFTLSLAR